MHWEHWPGDVRGLARLRISQYLAKDFDLRPSTSPGLSLKPGLRGYLAWVAKMTIACALFGLYLALLFYLILSVGSQLGGIASIFLFFGLFFLPFLIAGLVLRWKRARRNPTSRA